MSVSTLLLRFDAWRNRRALERAVATRGSKKLAEGVVMFLAFRRRLTRELGYDPFPHLSGMSLDERHQLLRRIKNIYLNMTQREKHMRKLYVNDDERYAQRFTRGDVDPFAYRLAATIGIQMMSAQMAPASGVSVTKCLEALLVVARPGFKDAYYTARTQRYMQTLFSPTAGPAPDTTLPYVEQLALEDLEHPFAPAALEAR
jgi:hypothetical protein